MTEFSGDHHPRGEVLVDFDANLLHDALKADIDEHISIAREHANVQYFVVPGSGLGDSSDALSLSRSRGESIVATAGVHPYHVIDETDIYSKENQEVLRGLCSQDSCMAVGETGLDYSEGFPDREPQLQWFRFQVSLALERNLPLFLHIRDAKADFLATMAEMGFPDKGPPPIRACVHCFTGDTEELKQYVEMGFYIGLTGYIFSMNDSPKLKEWLDIIPADRLVIETDAPYLGWAGCRASTQKKKKKARFPNVPASLSIICHELASTSGRSYDDMASSTTRNALEFFGLKTRC
jgi:TatD DNase family protein